jgi:biopolymer transport protein ExbD
VEGLMHFKPMKREESRFDLTPLVDVVFLLLIFFMLSTTFIVAPGIKVNLPTSSSTEISREKKEVRVVMAKDDKIFVEQKLVSIEELEKYLKKAARESPEGMVIIQADERVPHGNVVEVMDVAKTSGFNKLAIATRPKEREK